MNVTEWTDDDTDMHTRALQTAFYALAILIGLPINVITFVSLVRKYVQSRLPVLLLYLSLNLADILVSQNYYV